MEQRTIEEAIQKQGNIIAEAKTGKEVVSEPTESPIDEVRRLNRETKEMLQQLESTSKRLEMTAGEIMLSGRGFAGTPVKEKTVDELDRERADELVKKFLGRK